MLQHTGCPTHLYTFICTQNNSVFWDCQNCHRSPYKAWASVRALGYQNETSFYQASIESAWLPRAWGRDEPSQVLLVQGGDRTFLKCYRKCISSIFLPPCVWEHIPLGLAWETLSRCIIPGKLWCWMFHSRWGAPVQGALHIKLNFPTERGKTLE